MSRRVPHFVIALAVGVLVFGVVPSTALASDAPEGGGGLMDVALSQIVWTWVTFGVLLAILARFAWRPLQDKMDERAKRIEGDLAEARKLRDESEQRLKDYEAKLDAVREEIETMREEGRAQGEALMAQLEAKGQEEAEALKARAEKDITLEREKAIDEIRAQAVQLALLAAEHVVAKALTDADHERIAQEAIDNVAAL